MAQASYMRQTSWGYFMEKNEAVFQKIDITGSSNLTSKTPKPSWRLPPLNLTPFFDVLIVFDFISIFPPQNHISLPVCDSFAFFMFPLSPSSFMSDLFSPHEFIFLSSIDASLSLFLYLVYIHIYIYSHIFVLLQLVFPHVFLLKTCPHVELLCWTKKHGWHGMHYFGGEIWVHVESFCWKTIWVNKFMLFLLICWIRW